LDVDVTLKQPNQGCVSRKLTMIASSVTTNRVQWNLVPYWLTILWGNTPLNMGFLAELFIWPWPKDFKYWKITNM